MSSSHSTSQQSLKVDLDYYINHEALLDSGIYKTLGTASKVKAFQVENEISLQDFLNYFLIHRAISVNYATYADRINRISEAITWLGSVMSIKGTLNNLPGSERLQEYTGEAVGLSVASTLFGLTAADWATIPIRQFKAFDFEQTLTGITPNNDVIQIEVKGSFVKDNTVNQRKVSSHANNIAGKKTAIAKAGVNYAYPAVARYGLISSIDPIHTAKCFLLDPPGDQLEGEPSNHKIANRLAYVASIVSLLAPKATLPAALMERAALWREGAAEVPTGALRSATGHAFTAGNYVEDFLANRKVWLKSKDIVGQLFQGYAGPPFFLGLRGNVVRTVIEQNPRSIAEAQYELSSVQTTIVGWPKLLRSETKGDSDEHLMILHTASSGVVIGLPIKAK